MPPFRDPVTRRLLLGLLCIIILCFLYLLQSSVARLFSKSVVIIYLSDMEVTFRICLLVTFKLKTRSFSYKFADLVTKSTSRLHRQPLQYETRRGMIMSHSLIMDIRDH